MIWNLAFRLIIAISKKLLGRFWAAYGYIIFYAESLYLFIKEFFSRDVAPVVAPAAKVSIKLAASVAYVASGLVVITIYIDTVAYLITTVGQYTSSVMPPVILGAWGWVMPTNANICLLSIFTAYSARYFFDWYIYYLDARYKAVISTSGD